MQLKQKMTSLPGSICLGGCQTLTTSALIYTILDALFRAHAHKAWADGSAMSV